MNNIVEIFAYAIASIAFAAITYFFLVTWVQYRKTSAALAQSKVDAVALRAKLEELSANGDSKKIEQTEGFVKFISHSRDAAFAYIEEVQSAIADYDKAVGEMVKYYKETGKMPQKKPSDIMREFSQAHEKLMKAMPEENV